MVLGGISGVGPVHVLVRPVTYGVVELRNGEHLGAIKVEWSWRDDILSCGFAWCVIRDLSR